MRRNKQTDGERIVKDIKRKTRKQYSAEEKIRIRPFQKRSSKIAIRDILRKWP
jgi:hypothetical protein